MEHKPVKGIKKRKKLILEFREPIVAMPTTAEKDKIIRLFLTALEVIYYDMSEYEKMSESLTPALKTLIEKYK
jgi:hypothetical protein